jgi:hypothetical protein
MIVVFDQLQMLHLVPRIWPSRETNRSTLGEGEKSCSPLKTRKRLRDVKVRTILLFFVYSYSGVFLSINENSLLAQSVLIQSHLIMMKHMHLLTKYAADRGPGMPNLIFGTP